MIKDFELALAVLKTSNWYESGKEVYIWKTGPDAYWELNPVPPMDVPDEIYSYQKTQARVLH